MCASGLTVVVLVGSLRRDAATRAIANTLDELAPDVMQITLLDSPAVIAHYNRDVEEICVPAEVADMAGDIAAADAVVIVTPEYQGAMPGALKNTLDWLARLPERPLAGKAVALQGATHGSSGAANAQAQLREVLAAAGSRVLEGAPVEIARVGQKVDPLTDSLVDVAARTAISEQLERLASFIGKGGAAKA